MTDADEDFLGCECGRILIWEFCQQDGGEAKTAVPCYSLYSIIIIEPSRDTRSLSNDFGPIWSKFFIELVQSTEWKRVLHSQTPREDI